MTVDDLRRKWRNDDGVTTRQSPEQRDVTQKTCQVEQPQYRQPEYDEDDQVLRRD